MNRSTPLQRRTPLSPGKPLQRSSGLSGNEGLRVVQLVPAGQKRKAAPRDTGFSPSVKLAVRTRAGRGDALMARCECCNTWLGPLRGQVQHRVARKAGGRGPKAPPWINTITNAVLLCAPAGAQTGCHGRAERRERDMWVMGFWLPDSPGTDPGREPVRLHGDHGGVSVWLATDGTYSFDAPTGDAA